MRTMSQTDKVPIVRAGTNSQENDSISLFELAYWLNNDPFFAWRRRVAQQIDLVGGAKFQNILTALKGARITQVSFIITQTVVIGGTGVKLAIGTNGGTLNTWGNSTVLTKGEIVSNLFNGNPLSADTAIDIVAVATNGTSLSDTNITSGQIIFTCEIIRPPTFVNIQIP